ncbi:DUF817 family protein [Methylobacterium currus]|uniref:DUF817 family protein n=1 Tax=Methylobacterium currus TaxID=2051553 RepID=UPI0022AB280B|nr:DUF817 family protein [Methylobacterium currus]
MQASARVSRGEAAALPARAASAREPRRARRDSDGLRSIPDLSCGEGCKPRDPPSCLQPDRVSGRDGAGQRRLSGFPYASVGSYLARVWRLFDFRFTRHPPLRAPVVLSPAIDVNLFTQHVVTGLRLGLSAAAAGLFDPATIHFRVWRVDRRMPLLPGLLLVTLFIGLAETIGTATQGWIYPHQAAGWAAVSPQKFSSWFLLMIISDTLVALVSRPKALATAGATPSAAIGAAIDAGPARPTSPPATAGSLPARSLPASSLSE